MKALHPECIEVCDFNSNMENLMSVENLCVEIPVGAGLLKPVRGISFDLKKGETLCIVGESGCGKSLTSLALMGILPKVARANADKMTFAGEDLTTLSPRQMSKLQGNRISMIFQEPMTSLNPSYTIGNQLMEGMIAHQRVSRKEARDRAVFLLEKVGITAAASRLSQYPHQLSGGLRQRVMIAMSLLLRPQLLIADEPTTALDVTVQAQIMKLLSDLQGEFGTAIILITHDLGVVAGACENTLVMYGGRVMEYGTTEALFENPSHPYTQGLLRAIPRLDQEGEELLTIPGNPPNMLKPMQGCPFQPRCSFAHDRCISTEPALTDNNSLKRERACHVEPEALV